MDALLKLSDTALQKLFRDLDIDSPVRSVETEGDTLIIHTAWHTFEVPLPADGYNDTLPKSAGGRMEPQRAQPNHGLDDFTAIDGVGSVTAGRLHALGLYTYDDLREWLAVVEEVDGVGQATLQRIEAWLAQRLV